VLSVLTDTGRDRLAQRTRNLLLARSGPLLFLGLVLTVVSVLSLRAEIDQRYIDLEVYRFGVQAWLQGKDMYGTLPPTSVGAVLPFIYPPFAALLLSPFALLPWAVATELLFALSLVAAIVTLYLTSRRLWPAGGTRGALVLTGLALPGVLQLEPLVGTFGFGQINLLLMALVAVDCLTERPRWPRGLLVGIAAAIKLTPAAFVLFFLVRRDFRAVVVATLSGVAATLVGFLVAPGHSAHYWFGGLAGASGVSGTPFATNQTLRGALARLDPPALVQTGLWLLLVAVVLAAAVLVMRRQDVPGALAVNAAAALLVSPTSWSHHWVWVAPGLLVLFVHAVRVRSWLRLLVMAATTAIFVIAPHMDLPRERKRELLWTPVQHVIGNSYVLVTVALLLVAAVPAVRALWAGRRATPVATSR